MQAAANEQTRQLARFLPMMGAQPQWTPAPMQEAASYRVLLMERNVALAKLLATGLSSESLIVDVTHDVESATQRIESNSYGMAVLDVSLPEPDGINLLKVLRATQPDVKVLALGDRSGLEDLVSALDHGADDYVLKPLSLLELMARVRALRRRSLGGRQNAVPANKLVLRREECIVERDGRKIDLTRREFALLEFLMQNAGKTLSRSMLSEKVWNMPAEANTNIVDVYIKYLRDKLDGDHEEKLIRTVRGMGYLLQCA